MNFKVISSNAALACLALQWPAHAAQPPSTNVEFTAAGLEEHVGQANDRVTLRVYRGDAKVVLHKLDFDFSSPTKSLSLPKPGVYRISFETYEPDEEGATACTASARLEVAAEQKYQVAFTVLKRLCLLKTGRVAASGDFEELASVDGEVRRLQVKK
jgi:hypothetical protein